MKIFGKEINFKNDIKKKNIKPILVIIFLIITYLFYSNESKPYVEISLIDLQTVKYDLTSKDMELGISYMSNDFDKDKLKLPLQIKVSTLNPTQEEYITISKIDRKKYLKAFEYTIIKLDTEIELNENTALVINIYSELQINTTFLKFIKPEDIKDNEIMLFKNH